MSDFPFAGYRYCKTIKEMLENNSSFREYLEEMIGCLQDDYSEADEDAKITDYFEVPYKFSDELGTDKIWIEKLPNENVIRVFTDYEDA